jgi:putative drug exporter of the RND superfamily
VTSAGLVLAGTFGVLAVVGGSGSGNGQIRQIGFGLAIGILLDTFVVRTVLVPSTVSLLGRWNWWPSIMGKLPVADSPTNEEPVGKD